MSPGSSIWPYLAPECVTAAAQASTRCFSHCWYCSAQPRLAQLARTRQAGALSLPSLDLSEDRVFPLFSSCFVECCCKIFSFPLLSSVTALTTIFAGSYLSSAESRCAFPGHVSPVICNGSLDNYHSLQKVIAIVFRVAGTFSSD